MHTRIPHDVPCRAAIVALAATMLLSLAARASDPSYLFVDLRYIDSSNPGSPQVSPFFGSGAVGINDRCQVLGLSTVAGAVPPEGVSVLEVWFPLPS